MHPTTVAHAQAAEAWQAYYAGRKAPRRRAYGAPGRRLLGMVAGTPLHATKGPRHPNTADSGGAYLRPWTAPTQRGPGKRTTPHYASLLSPAEAQYLRQHADKQECARRRHQRRS